MPILMLFISLVTFPVTTYSETREALEQSILGIIATSTIKPHEGDVSNKFVSETLLRKREKIAEFRMIANEAIVQAETIEDLRAKIEVLSGIAEAQSEAKQYSSAKRTIHLAQQIVVNATSLGHPVYDWYRSAIAKAQIKSGDVRGAQENLNELFRIVKESKENGSTGRIMRDIAKDQAKAGSLTDALRTIAATSDPYRSASLSGIAFVQAQAGDLKSARQTITAIPDDGVKSYASKRIVGIQTASGDIEGALDTATTISHDLARASALLTIADRLVILGDLPKAIEVAATIPTVDAGNTFLSPYHPIVPVKKFSNSSNNRYYGPSQAIAEIQILAGDIKGALTSVQNISNDLHKAFTLKVIGEIQFRNGHKSNAHQTLQLALQIVKGTSNNPDTFTVLDAIVHSQIKVRDFKNINQTIASLGDGSSKRKAFLDIAIARAEIGDKNGALAHVRLAQESATRIKNKIWRADALDRVASARVHVLVQFGEFELASRLVTSIQDPIVKADNLLTIAEAQEKNGKYAEAKQTLQLTREILKSAAMGSPDWEFPEIAVRQVQAGAFENIVGVLSSFQADYQAYTVLSIVELLIEMRHKTNARRFLEFVVRIPNVLKGDRNLYYLAMAHAKANHLKMALKITALISSDHYFRGTALWQIVLIALKEAGIQGDRTLSDVYTRLVPGIHAAGVDPYDQLPDTTGDKNTKGYIIVPVFYGTDRALTKEKNSIHYGPQRGSELKYGICRVSIPTNPGIHKVGGLESPFWGFKLWGISSFFESLQKHVLITSVEPKTKLAFHEELTKKINRSENKDAFVFIHGFNVSFADACRRTGQISYDLKFKGVPILYSWPSQTELTPTGYLTDGDSVKRAIPHLRRFLKDIQDNSGAQIIHLIAHSMGNRALTGVLKDIANELRTAKAPPVFKEVVLAAPDIDAEIFLRLADEMQGAAQRITLYSSSNDKALLVSRSLHSGYPRAGEAGEKIVLATGIDTIDASWVDTDLTGHSYYADSKSVLSDIFYLLRGILVKDRAFLKRKDRQTLPYWEYQP